MFWKKHEKLKDVLCALAFFAVLAAVCFHVQGLFGVDSNRSYEHERLFVREKKGSLDCVLIGASTVHASWQPAFAWSNFGIATWNYSIDGLGQIPVKYLLAEARKTQPDAVYVICLNGFKKDLQRINIEPAHWLLDYLPWSANKVQLIEKIAETYDYSFSEKLELYLPIIRFHSRWDSLDPWVFGGAGYDYKGSMHTTAFRETVYDNSKKYLITDKQKKASKKVMAVVDDLLDYCDENHVNVLFWQAPQGASEKQARQMNYLQEYVVSRGYPCVDLLRDIGSTALDLERDFYNNDHTNVHGSIKITNRLGKYLAEQYGLADKRGQQGWESWDAAAESYQRYLEQYILPFEMTGTRTADLGAPSCKARASGQRVELTWDEIPGADRYEIYRKSGGAWKFAAETDLAVLNEYDLKPETGYTYTVVPVALRDGVKCYGHFNVKGVSVTTGGGGE